MDTWLQVGPENNRAYLAEPEGGSGPGVLVLHAWWGLTPVFTDICDQLAAEGFVALAPGLYTADVTTGSIAEAEKLASSAQTAAEATALAAVERLRGLPSVTDAPLGVVGYSLGAYWALILSQKRPEDIGSVVVYYGTGDADFSTARSAYLGHFAENDDYEPRDWVQEVESRIRGAGRDVEFHTYPGTGHWFAEPNRPDAFNTEAAALAWERTLFFLKGTLV